MAPVLLTSEVGWGWTLLNGTGVKPKHIVNPTSHVHLNLRELHVEGRHLICRSRLSITLTYEELVRMYKGGHGDNLMDAIYICKIQIIQAHEPCPFLQAKVMVYNREGAKWEPGLKSSSATSTNSEAFSSAS
jgi:hypothetical protein